MVESLVRYLLSQESNEAESHEEKDIMHSTIGLRVVNFGGRN